MDDYDKFTVTTGIPTKISHLIAGIVVLAILILIAYVSTV